VPAATAVLLLLHEPPVVGLIVVVPPIHKFVLAPVIFVEGFAPTVITDVASLGHPVLVCVNVNVAVPADTPVTNPAFVTVATAALLLAHVPPELGLNVDVLPIHNDVPPVMLTLGLALTVNGAVANDVHPVLVNVYVNVAVPALTAVIKPAFVMVATAVLLLLHVPKVVGLTMVVPPIHKLVLAPVIFVVGLALTVIALVASLGHSVALLVNVNVAVPGAIPVTTPAFVTVATAVLLLAHVPPVVGLKVDVLPIQSDEPPEMLTVGFAFTVNGAVATDVHPELVSVYVNVAEPAPTAVITPAFVIVATAVLLLVQVPKVVGLTVVVPPIHKLVLAPVMFVVGLAMTFTDDVILEQPAAFVKVKVTVPAATPVTTPVFVTVATAGLLLTHVPPIVGVRDVVLPTQTLLDPTVTVGKVTQLNKSQKF
jgi:hypothetical protein